jgi:DNA polymerase zeta
MPDPAKDAISAIAFSFQNEDDGLEDTGSRPGLRTGLLLLDKHGTLPDPARLGIAGLDVEVLSTELELFNALVDLVRTLDPEILVGWEIHNSSWGYVVDRAMKELSESRSPPGSAHC